MIKLDSGETSSGYKEEINQEIPYAKKTVSPEEWGKRYEAKRSLYKTFTEELHKLIEKCLSNRNIDVAQIQSRTKTVKRFVEKIEIKGQKYENPLREITDLSGARIIAYYKEDVDAIVKMIEDEFEIDWENSVDKTKELPLDRFGYQSDHYVVSLSSPRKDLVEWKLYKGLKAEIQIRTGLQHVWAERDHELRYESFKEAPPELGRRLFRLSAVLELADAEFSYIRELRKSVKEEYSEEVKRGALDMKLNLDSLEAYLKSNPHHLRWSRVAKEVGFNVIDLSLLDTKWGSLCAQGKGNLLDILNLLGVKTIEELNKIILGASDWGEEMLKNLNKTGPVDFKEKNLDPYAVLAFMVLYSQKSTVNEEILSQTHFNSDVKKTLTKFLGLT